MRSASTTFGTCAAPLEQRREDYRVEVPVEDEVTCTLRFARKFERPAYAVRLDLCDVSAGGLSLADYDRRLVDMVGFIVRDCELRLPGERKTVLVDLRLLRAQTEPLLNKLAVTRVSSQFLNLSDAASQAIRRYVSDVQRRQIARERGLD